MSITEAPNDYRFKRQLIIAQSLADLLHENKPSLAPEQIAALTTLVLISDYHQSYVPQADLYCLGKAILDYEPKATKGFAKTVSPLQTAYEFALSKLIRMPYTFHYDAESSQYYLAHEAYS